MESAPQHGSPALRIRRNLSTLINRNVTVCGRRTSVRLERSMWDALEEICVREHKLMNQLATEIGQDRIESSLTASIRVYVMEYFRAASSEDGHQRAGHGEKTALRISEREKSNGKRSFLMAV